MKKINKPNIEKLSNLPDFPYEAKYEKNIAGFEDYKDMRMAYIDTGNKDSDLTFLLLTWFSNLVLYVETFYKRNK
jgi:hypothetical protein